MKFNVNQQDLQQALSYCQGVIEKIKEKDPDMAENINKLKNQILYNNKNNEI